MQRMQREQGGHECTAPQGAGHVLQHQEQQQRLRHVQQPARQMVPACVQPGPLHVQDMREPAQGMPVAIVARRKGPGKPTEEFRQEGREVRLWEVGDLTFSKTYGRAIRVVRAEEQCAEFKIVGGKRKSVPKQSNWLGVVTEDLDAMVAGPF